MPASSGMSSPICACDEWFETLSVRWPPSRLWTVRFSAVLFDKALALLISLTSLLRPLAELLAKLGRFSRGTLGLERAYVGCGASAVHAFPLCFLSLCGLHADLLLMTIWRHRWRGRFPVMSEIIAGCHL